MKPLDHLQVFFDTSKYFKKYTFIRAQKEFNRRYRVRQNDFSAMLLQGLTLQMT